MRRLIRRAGDATVGKVVPSDGHDLSAQALTTPTATQHPATSGNSYGSRSSLFARKALGNTLRGRPPAHRGSQTDGRLSLRWSRAIDVRSVRVRERGLAGTQGGAKLALE